MSVGDGAPALKDLKILVPEDATAEAGFCEGEVCAVPGAETGSQQPLPALPDDGGYPEKDGSQAATR